MIDVKHTALRRGGTVVMDNGAISIPVGATIGLVGINGAGKSTWMNGIAGILAARCGAISATLEGRVLRVVLSAQHATFPPWLTAYETAALYGIAWTDLAALDDLMLDEIRDVRCGRLSTGQSQILATALAIASGAPLILLDEPYAALDFRRRIALTRFFQRRPASDASVIISSPSVGDLVSVCGWIIVISKGKYVYNGPMAGLLNGARPEVTDQQQIEEKLMAMLDDR